MSGKILPFKKKGQVTREEFEGWADTFEPFDLGNSRDPNFYEKVEKDLSSAFNTLGMGVKDRSE
jgi:hypothetical protein